MKTLISLEKFKIGRTQFHILLSLPSTTHTIPCLFSEKIVFIESCIYINYVCN